MKDQHYGRREIRPHDRRSIRLAGYDYAQAGLYFITLCIQNRLHLFGTIQNDQMVLNAAGSIAERCWLAIPEHFPHVALHEHVIMPNHMHGIIEIMTTPEASSSLPIPKNKPNQAPYEQSPLLRSPSKTVGSIVRGYKIGVTKWFRENMPEAYPVGTRVWQRNYWEHIIRNQDDYERIAQYIINNPKSWGKDKLK